MTPTPRQAVILAWLERVAPHAARMYETALRVAADEQLPCRGRMIAHALREVCCVLMNEYSADPGEQSEAAQNELAAEYGRLKISSPFQEGSSPAKEPSRPVPDSFLKAVATVVRNHTTKDNARERSRQMFEALLARPRGKSDVQPISDRWYEMSKRFPAWSHDRDKPDAELMDGVFRQEVEFFEQTLGALAGPAAPILDGLDDILERANS